MSAARAHHKESEPEPKGHPFRNVLVVSLLLAALILWQLTPIIHGLHYLESLLTRAEGPRRIIISLIHLGYTKLVSLVSPLIHKIG
jgi:hypothetical protein